VSLLWPVQISNAAIAVSDHGLYDLGVSTERETSSPSSGPEQLHGQIGQLESQLEHRRSQEQLMAKTLISATNHAIAIRESARREAELTLRKARAEAEKLKAGAERERDAAQRELLRLRRITEQMRNGLSAFLTSKVEELRLETEGATNSGQDDELETALGSALEARSATGLHGSAGGPHAVP
jgi:cell division septum initiation protein DivIVA